MKLDESIIDKIEKIVYDSLDAYEPVLYEQVFRNRLRSLDLVIKPGDSSQGTLVENK